MTENQIQLVNAATLATMLQVSTRTLSTWSNEGIIPKPVKIKGRVFWDLADVKAAINKLQVK